MTERIADRRSRRLINKAIAEAPSQTMRNELAVTEFAQREDQLQERLEQGGTSLEESLALWERGERLADVCQRWLDGARARLDAARNPANNGEAAPE